MGADLTCLIASTLPTVPLQQGVARRSMLLSSAQYCYWLECPAYKLQRIARGVPVSGLTGTEGSHQA